jgi:V/A-type H+-transporting ATPase subunit E
MENKIQALTDKIYREGVEKGNEDARIIIEKAQQEAQVIVENARREAEATARAAQKAADELSENTHSELKLFAGQALNALKSEIVTVITTTIANQAVADSFADKDFMPAFLLKLAEQWDATEGGLVVGAADAEALKRYFTAKAKTLLDKGLVIEQVNGRQTQFTVAPADGAYKVGFGDEEFANYFKAFLRPQLVEMLF